MGGCARGSAPRSGLTRVQEIGKALVVVGIVLAVAGAILWSGFGKGWLGRLPGDIHIERGNFSLHFPLITCIVLSILLTVLLNLFKK